MKLANWVRLRFKSFVPVPVWRWIVVWAMFLLIVAGTIWIVLPDWLAGDESGSTTIRNLFLAIAALIALPLAIWRSSVAERQAEATQKQSETAQIGLLNEHYQKGAEMLGSSTLAVRLGGIYALQRLAQEHDEYHMPIIRLFCAFVCNPPKPKDEKPATTNGAGEGSTRPPPDVVAIMEAITTRKVERVAIEQGDGYRLDFRNANLGGLDLLRIDKVDLSWSRLTGANLSHIQLPRETNFSWVREAYGTKISNGRLNRVNFESCNFSETDLSNSLLIGANLQCADLREANLSNATLANADLSGATFRDAILSGAKFSLDDHPPARGLTQDQLDVACADMDNPPNLDGVIDEVTRQPLVWRGRSLGDEGN